MYGITECLITPVALLVNDAAGGGKMGGDDQKEYMLRRSFFIVASLLLLLSVCRAQLLGRERVERNDLESRNGKHMCFVLPCFGFATWKLECVGAYFGGAC